MSREKADLLKDALALVDSASADEGRKLYSNAAKSYRKAASLMRDAAALVDGGAKEQRMEGAKALERKASKLELVIAEDGIHMTNSSVQAQIPNVTFNDVAGLEEVKKQINAKIIFPAKYPDLAAEFRITSGGGILLYGPPGVGKTHIVRAIANEIRYTLYVVNPSTLLSQWFGEFEKNIHSLFEVARENSPSIIFFDDFDAVAPKRGKTNSSVMKRAVPALLTELDGFDRNSGTTLLILAATNEPWDIDSALLRPGRFDERIYIPPPDSPARKKLFEIGFAGVRGGESLDLNELADQSDGYSGADITYVCKKTRSNVFLENVQIDSSRGVAMQDIYDALQEVKPSINRSMIDRYEKYQDSRV